MENSGDRHAHLEVPSVEEMGYNGQVLLQGCFNGLKGVVHSPQCGILCVINIPGLLSLLIITAGIGKLILKPD